MTMFRRVLTASVVAITLASVPSHAAPKESQTRAAETASALDWFSSLWNEIATWLGEVPTPPPTGPESFLDGRCAVDPNGCPEGQ
jgi:hypothetical protein